MAFWCNSKYMDQTIIAALIDTNSTLILKKGIPEIRIFSKNKEIIKILSTELSSKISLVNGFYVIYGKTNKIINIFDKFKESIFLNRSRLIFLINYIEERKAYNNEISNLQIFKNSKIKEFKEIPIDILTGNEPESYKKIFLDEINSFQFSSFNGKYSFCWSKNLKNTSYKQSYKNCLKDFNVIESENYDSLRLRKHDTLNLAKYIKDTSFHKEFFNTYIASMENTDVDLAKNKIICDSIKVTPLDKDILTAETNVARMEEKAERRDATKASKDSLRAKERADKIKALEEKRKARKEFLAIQKIQTLNHSIERSHKKKLTQLERREKKIKLIEEEVLTGFKVCRICKEKKPIDLFGISKTNFGGYKYECKRCGYEKYVDLEDRRVKTRAWQKANPEKVRELDRREKQKPKNRIKRSVKTRLREFMFKKDDLRYKEIIGCKPDELQIHLESKFYANINWDNYGTVWDVDHIIPCEAFDHTKKDEVLLCWNYKNLQPLLKIDNNIKSDSLPNGLSARALAKENPQELAEIKEKMLIELGIK